MDDPASKIRIRRWFATMAFGVLLVLAIAPETGWIVRRQLANVAAAVILCSTLVDDSDEESAQYKHRVRKVGALHPVDLPFQFAVARALAPASTNSNFYEPLTEQFSHQPSLHANVLRLSFDSEILIQRREIKTLEPVPNEFHPRFRPEMNQPDTIRRFLSHTTAGERLDAKNAFFPLMASVALFATNRDTEALAAIRRAAGKRSWNEYSSDPIVGIWQLDEALGRRGARRRSSQAASREFPHYAPLHSAAQLATYQAMRAEQRGELDRGFRIRQNVMRIGSLLRAQGSSLATNWLGRRMIRTAMMRPLAAAPIPYKTRPSSAAKGLRNLDQYCLYLHRIGQQEEVSWVRAEVTAGQTMNTLQTVVASGVIVWGEHETTLSYWLSAQILLLGAVWWIALGLIATLLCRTSWGQSRQPLPKPLKRGMALGVGVLLLTAVFAEGLQRLPATDDTGIFRAFAPVWLLTLFCLWLYWNRRKPSTWIALAGIGIVLVLLPGLSLLFLAQATHTSSPLVEANGVQHGLLPERIAVFLGVFALPIAATLLFALLGWLQQVPAGISIARGFRASALPMICLLLVAYAGVVVATLPHEAELNYQLERVQQHEGRFIAEIAGKPWPGPTR